jgi:hypothetical protein
MSLKGTTDRQDLSHFCELIITTKSQIACYPEKDIENHEKIHSILINTAYSTYIEIA